MNRRHFLRSAAVAGTFLAGRSQWKQLMADNVTQAKGNKLNVLFLFADDQRWNTINALGNPHIKTPTLDKLAKRSFVFHQGFCFGGNTGAVCIPARNMTMTGRVWCRFPKGPRGQSIRADGKWPNFPKSMKAAGYETFYREKSGSANLPQIRKDIHMVNALRTGRPAQGIVNDAIQFLTKSRDKNRPFFMYLGLPCPHDPRWSLKKFRDLYNPDKLPVPTNFKPAHPWNIGDMTVRDECLEVWPRTKKAIQRHLFDYYSVISSMDYDLGRLMNTLKKAGLADNTIIVFSSDQGLAMGSHGLLGKQSVYDDVLRVPLLFSGPGIAKGESQALSYIHDIYPTICDMVGAPVPDDIDGKSLAGIIRGKKTKVRDHLMLAYKNSQRSISDGQWKLIRFPQINRSQLFDIKNDPHETNDLADSTNPKHQAIMKKLWLALEAEQKQYGDPLPLTSKKPKKAEWTPPTKKLRTAYPAGGLAPGDPSYKRKKK